MLTKLLKYEFKATGRVYGGLYLAILAAAALLGLSFRFPIFLVHTAPIAVLMIVYLALVVAIVVMTVFTIVQRFTRNLLGREGYLMHTLPVSSVQLILSKLISSMVWVLCSILAVLLSFGVFSLFGSLNSSTFSDLMHSLASYGPEITQLLGTVVKGYGFAMGLLVLEWLASLACAILCLYTACMIGHQFKRHVVLAGIAAFVVLNVVQNQLLNLLPYNSDNAMGLNLVFSTSASDGSLVYTVSGNKAYVWAVLAALAVDLVVCAVYFAATNWMMKNKLNLE